MTPQEKTLIESARMGDIDGVKAALAADANIHADHDEALRWGADHGHAEVVSLLLAAGADPAVALKSAIEKDRGNNVATTLDACAAVLSKEQRAALLSISRPSEFVQSRAIAASAVKHRTMRR